MHETMKMRKVAPHGLEGGDLFRRMGLDAETETGGGAWAVVEGEGEEETWVIRLGVFSEAMSQRRWSRPFVRDFSPFKAVVADEFKECRAAEPFRLCGLLAPFQLALADDRRLLGASGLV